MLTPTGSSSLVDARAPAIQPSDLNNLPFITATDEAAPVLHRVIRDFISEQGIRPSQTYEVENLSMVFSLIASIGGITLLPEYAFRLCPPTVAAVRLELEPPMIDLALAYHPDNRSDVLRTFVRHFERLTAGEADGSGVPAPQGTRPSRRCVRDIPDV